MASETTWICDWCGERVENTDRYPTEWAHLDPGYAKARQGRVEVQLFPKEMTVERTEEHPSHYEGELCGDCFKAILDALKNVRELRISKREKK